jgi:hypothetical protein
MPRDERRRQLPDDLEPYLTAFGERSSGVFSALDRLREAEHGITQELLRRLAGSDLSFVCERCGALVWLEVAEYERLILVEADGTPHEDRCRPVDELFKL